MSTLADGVSFDLGDGWQYALESATPYVTGSFSQTATFLVDRSGNPFMSGVEYHLWAMHPTVQPEPVMYGFKVDQNNNLISGFTPFGITMEGDQDWQYALESDVPYVPGTFSSNPTFLADKDGNPFVPGVEYRAWAMNPLIQPQPLMYTFNVDANGLIQSDYVGNQPAVADYVNNFSVSDVAKFLMLIDSTPALKTMLCNMLLSCPIPITSTLVIIDGQYEEIDGTLGSVLVVVIIDGQYEEIGAGAINTPPIVVNPFPDSVVTATGSQTIPYNPATVFFDTDALTYSFKQTNGNDLPAGISYDATGASFDVSGSFANSQVAIRVKATDTANQSVYDDFLLTVTRTVATPVADGIYRIEDGIDSTSLALTAGANLQLFVEEQYTNVSGTTIWTVISMARTWSLVGAIAGDTINASGLLHTAGSVTRQLGVRATLSNTIVVETTILIAGSIDSAPVLNTPTQFLTSLLNTPFSYSWPAAQFTDPDGDALSWSLEFSTDNSTWGDLPSWAHFTPGTRTFYGTPPALSGVTGHPLHYYFRRTVDDNRGGVVHDAFFFIVVQSNVALASEFNTTVAVSSVRDANYGLYLTDGLHKSGGAWQPTGSTGYATISLGQTRAVQQVIVYTERDNYTNLSDLITDSETFSLYGVTAFRVQVPDSGVSGGWRTVATVTGNNHVKRSVTFATESTTQVRVIGDSAVDGVIRIYEIEVYEFII